MVTIFPGNLDYEVSIFELSMFELPMFGPSMFDLSMFELSIWLNYRFVEVVDV